MPPPDKHPPPRQSSPTRARHSGRGPRGPGPAATSVAPSGAPTAPSPAPAPQGLRQGAGSWAEAERCRRGPRAPTAPGAGAQGGWWGQQLGARCAARMHGPGAPVPQETAPPATAVNQDRGQTTVLEGVPMPLGLQNRALLPRAVPEMGTTLLSPDLRKGSVGWRDRDGAKQVARPVTQLAKSHHHPRHRAWGQTKTAPRVPSLRGSGVGSHGCCP